MLDDIVGLFRAAHEHEKKRREKLGRWGRFKEDFPSNLMAFVTAVIFVTVFIVPWFVGLLELVFKLTNQG